MRRLIRVLLVAALLAATACAPGDTLDLSGGTGPCGGAGSGQTLVVGIGHDISQRQEQVALMQQWARQCGVDLSVVQLSPDTDLARGTYVAAAQGRSPLSFDVIVADAVDVPELAELGYLRPLSVPDDHLRVFPSAAVDTGRYDGDLYALPYTLNAGLLYYRRDVIGRDPSISRTRPWRDIGQVCAAAGHLGPEGCLVTQLAGYEGRTVNALEAAWSSGPGGALFKPYTDVSAVHPGAAMPGLSRLVSGTAGGNGVIAPVSLGARERESIEAFGARRPKAIFMRNWPYVYDVLAQEFHLVPGRDFGVLRLPWPSVLGGESMAVTTTSTAPDAAGALVRAMTGVDGWRIKNERGAEVLPPRELFRVGGQAVARTDVYGYRDRPYAPLVAAALREARPRPVTPAYPAVSAAIQSTVGGWLGHPGAADPDALATAISDAAGRR